MSSHSKPVAHPVLVEPWKWLAWQVCRPATPFVEKAEDEGTNAWHEFAISVGDLVEKVVGWIAVGIAVLFMTAAVTVTALVAPEALLAGAAIVGVGLFIAWRLQLANERLKAITAEVVAREEDQS